MRLGKSPFCWLEFDATGNVLEEAATIAAIEAMLAAPGITDLLVISHGWRSDKDDALNFYKPLWDNVSAALNQRDPEKVAIVGILWPSKPFAEDFDVKSLKAAKTQGALSIKPGEKGKPLSKTQLDKVMRDFALTFGKSAAKDTIAAARNIVRADEITGPDAAALLKAAKELLSPPTDSETRAGSRAILKNQDPSLLLVALSRPSLQPIEPGAGQVNGLIGDFVGNIIQGTAAGVGRFLNLLTFLEMKERSGVVGKALGTNVLPKLGLGGIRLHLVGHSFGARLISAAVNFAPTSVNVESMTLLQGAFSHNAYRETFEGQPGAFPRVIGRPLGPLAVTHTFNDKAVTLAYSLASRLANQTTSGIGDPSDPFGAMGANGPQGMTSGTFAPPATDTQFLPRRGKVNTFRADAYVSGHNDVCNATVGRLVAAVIQA